MNFSTDLVFLPTATQFLRGDRSWSPLLLCLFCLFLFGCNFRFHGFDQLCELFLAFLSCLGVYILGYAFAAHSRHEPPLVEVVVYHRHASRAALAYLALVRLKFLLWRGFRGGGFTCLGWLHALREFGHFCVCTADFSVNSHGCLLLHGVGDMAVDVERGLRADVAYHSGKSLDIHAVFKCHRCEGVAKVGISEIRAELLPEEKVENIVSLQKDERKVCMIGDGVNDAPALKTADVGVAMGSMGSDIAVEAADIALMSDDISKIPYLKRLSNATVKTIKFSITLSMCINFLAVALSVLGVLNPTTGALVHNAGSCFVVLIAALLYDRKLD